jgi:hypothetical protein
MSAHPWIKFYPRDWRGDQALRVCSLAARGLWMEMLCIMHEATPYGHLFIGAQPVADDALARLAGSSISEVQALLVELQNAQVLRLTRTGVIFSKRMVADEKRAINGRKAKLAALKEAAENKPEKPRPSRVPKRPPPTQKPDTRGKLEGPTKGPSNLTDAPTDAAPLDRAASSALEPGPGASLEERKKLADEMRQSVGLRVVSG